MIILVYLHLFFFFYHAKISILDERLLIKDIIFRLN